ncbi:MAG: hypothetical protein AAGG68_10720 [Bacteroidota bacterium]
MNNLFYTTSLLLIFFTACNSTSDNTKSVIEESETAIAETYTFNAVEDYNSLSVEGFPKPYVDKNRKAIALNAVEHKGVYTAVNYLFEGESNTYDLQLNTLCELDGESNYRIAINGKLLEGIRTNPVIFGTEKPDYTPASHTWKKVNLSKDDTIRVEASSETNGKIPEGEITAYSRGRFTSLELSSSN